jgi:predicted RNA-binding protein YlxR (DUF448 family)
MGAKKVPLRKCIACQHMLPKKSLLRVVRTPEGEVNLDPSGKASGRGAYICSTEECLALAQKKNAFERALSAKLNDNMYEGLQRHLKRLELIKKDG